MTQNNNKIIFTRHLIPQSNNWPKKRKGKIKVKNIPQRINIKKPKLTENK